MSAGSGEAASADALEVLGPLHRRRADVNERLGSGKGKIDERGEPAVELALRERPDVDDRGPAGQGFRETRRREESRRARQHVTARSGVGVDLGFDRADQWIARTLDFVDEPGLHTAAGERDRVDDRRLEQLLVVEVELGAAVVQAEVPQECRLTGLPGGRSGSRRGTSRGTLR